ncbi:Cytokinesis protein sepA, partial [Smittium culicis]
MSFDPGKLDNNSRLPSPKFNIFDREDSRANERTNSGALTSFTNSQASTIRSIFSYNSPSRGSFSSSKSNNSTSPVMNTATNWGDSVEGDGKKQNIDYKNTSEIDSELEAMMNDMNLKDEQKEKMRAIPLDKKIILLQSKTQYKEFKGDKSKPSAFCRILKDYEPSNLQYKQIIHLRVCLTTQPIAWVKEFVNRDGFKYLSIVLKKISISDNRFENRTTRLEFEILKCMKVILNIEWGVQEALRSPECITALCLSLDSKNVYSCKMAAELITFVCYQGSQTGHSYVVKGFERMKVIRNESNLFSAWFYAFDQQVDQALSIYSKTNQKSSTLNSIEREIVDMSIAFLILINTIISVCDDAELRTEYRAQLTEAGIGVIIKKLDTFQSDSINLQVEKYMNELEEDYKELLDSCETDDYESESEVSSILSALKDFLTSNNKTSDNLLSVLQHLLLLKDPTYGSQSDNLVEKVSLDDNEIFVNRLQLVDRLIDRVVIEKKAPESADLLTNAPGSVDRIISSFSNEDGLIDIIKENNELRDKCDRLSKANSLLEQENSKKSEGLVGNLKSKIFALEDLLRMSRHNIEGLQTQNKELRREYAERLQKQEIQNKKTYLAVETLSKDSQALVVQRIMLQLENAALRSGKSWDFNNLDKNNVPTLNLESLESEIKRLKSQPNLNIDDSFIKSKFEQIISDDKPKDVQLTSPIHTQTASLGRSFGKKRSPLLHTNTALGLRSPTISEFAEKVSIEKIFNKSESSLRNKTTSQSLLQTNKLNDNV